MRKEKIIINITSDYMECDLCGSNSEDSCEIKMGEWSFGCIAFAHCYGSRSTEESYCFIALFKHLAIDYYIDPNEDFDQDSAVNFLLSLGYEVEVDINLYEEDYNFEYYYSEDD